MQVSAFCSEIIFIIAIVLLISEANFKADRFRLFMRRPLMFSLKSVMLDSPASSAGLGFLLKIYVHNCNRLINIWSEFQSRTVSAFYGQTFDVLPDLRLQVSAFCSKVMFINAIVLIISAANFKAERFRLSTCWPFMFCLISVCRSWLSAQIACSKLPSPGKFLKRNSRQNGFGFLRADLWCSRWSMSC